MYRVNLEDGDNTVSFVVTDGTGNAAEFSKDIYVDTVPPQLSVSEDINGKVVTEGSIYLNGYTEAPNPSPVHKTARCKRYEAASGWYGLMSPDGKVLTNPNYSDIIAIGYDLYLCKNGSMSGEVLNGKGIKVK